MERKNLVAGLVAGLVIGILIGFQLNAGVEEPKTGVLEEQLTGISQQLSEFESFEAQLTEMTRLITEMEMTISGLEEEIDSLELEVAQLSETDEVPVIVSYREVQSLTSDVSMTMALHEVSTEVVISTSPISVKWEFTSGDTSDIQISVYDIDEPERVHNVLRESTDSGEVRLSISPGDYQFHALGDIEFIFTIEEPV